MKKLILMLMLLTALFVLTACGRHAAQDTTPDTAADTAADTAPAETETAPAETDSASDAQTPAPQTAAAAATAEGELAIDYGASDHYTRADMDAAIACIQAEFAGWEGCVLHSVTYAGDEWNDPAAVKWLNQLKAEKQAEGPEYTECIMFLSSFHSPADGGGAWRPDDEYTGWQWWLGRPAGGDWQLMSWGY